MPELDADFEISTNNLEAEYEISEGQHFDCSFEIYASGTSWGNIAGDIENQLDLQEQFATKADVTTVQTLSESISTIETTINSYGDIVDYNATDFATSVQGALADSAIQPNDSISLLSNDVGYITSSDLSNYATLDDLSSKQDTISDLDEIRSDAQDGQTAYNTIQNYGDIVLYNANEFATSVQGALASTALQPNDNITELNNNAGFITSASLPTVNNSTIKFQKNGSDIETITLNQSDNSTVNYQIPTQASDINAVPTSRTINSKALSANISLNSSDVGALADTTTINDLTTTAQQNALNSNITSSLTSQISTNQGDIADIKDVIPSAASTSNQLADKNFVNSSIATNTANFIGTFTSVADLEAYSGTLTNNDYAFVETTDSAGNTLYDRYKYTTATTPASWQFEYELNNSSFTATQWAAINSGANSTNIGQIATNTNDISNINTTIGGYGDVVTYSASDFATASQGTKADTALQSGDNVSELVNNAGYLVSSDLTGYATETWVGNQGYITGINSTDVTNALGYTPYDASNPNGYTSNVGTVTSVNNVQPDSSGNVTISVSGGANTDLSNLTATGEAHFQAPLVSGTNIKTINSTSLLGSGNISTLINSSPDSSSLVISGSGYNVSNAISLGSASAVESIGGIAIGWGSSIGINSNYSIAIGYGAMASGSNSIAIGQGAVSSANTLTIGFGGIKIYDLLDGTTGLIPDDRISTNIARTSQIPTNNNQLTNGAGYITGINSSDVTTALGYTPENITNKVTSISSSSTDTQYPSAKLLYDQLALKENSLGFTPANQDLSNLSSTGKRVMDSGIVAKYAQLESATSANGRAVNLSTYLPSNDTYLVYIRLTANYNSAEAYYGIGNVQNPYTNRDSAIWYMGCAVSSSSRFSYLHCWVPVTNKTLYSQIYGGALKAGIIQAYGYRKVGTNS